jgi:hypothetical protein
VAAEYPEGTILGLDWIKACEQLNVNLTVGLSHSFENRAQKIRYTGEASP